MMCHKYKSGKSELGYVTDYTSGIYLSGIIILILSAIGIVVTLRLPYESYILFPRMMLDLLFGSFVGVVASLLFLKENCVFGIRGFFGYTISQQNILAPRAIPAIWKSWGYRHRNWIAPSHNNLPLIEIQKRFYSK